MLKIGDKVVITALCKIGGLKLYPVGTEGRIVEIDRTDLTTLYRIVEDTKSANRLGWWYEDGEFKKIA